MPSGKYISEQVREEILRLKALGLTNEVVAIRTGVSYTTVRNVVKRDKQGGKS